MDQLIISKAKIVPELTTPNLRRFKKQGSMIVEQHQEQREWDEFQTFSSTDHNGQESYHRLHRLSDFLTIRPDRFKEEQENQLSRISSAGQQLMGSSRTCYCEIWSLLPTN